MTLVLRHKNRYYADSKVMLNDQLVFNMDKIRPCKNPFEIFHEGEKIHDFIHGYTFTGASDQVEALIERLRSINDLAMVEMMYEMADKCKLINDVNQFSAVLIGEKKDYNVTIGFETDFLTCHERSDDVTWSMGSGRSAFEKIIKMYPDIDIARAMWMTFLKEASCGGMIDVWELSKKPFIHLRRLGMYNRISGPLTEQFGKLFRPDLLSIPVPMDLIINRDVKPVKPEKIYSNETTTKKVLLKLERDKRKVDQISTPDTTPPAKPPRVRKRKKPHG